MFEPAVGAWPFDFDYAAWESTRERRALISRGIGEIALEEQVH